MLSPRKPIFASFRRSMVWCHDTEGYASLHPRLRATRSARAFDLSGRAAVIGCGKLVINSRGWAVADIISVKSVRDFHHIAHLRDENICEI